MFLCVYRSSAYAVFSVQMLTEMKSSDLHGQKLMVEVGKAWSNLSEDRKQAFRDRWQKVLFPFYDYLPCAKTGLILKQLSSFI